MANIIHYFCIRFDLCFQNPLLQRKGGHSFVDDRAVGLLLGSQFLPELLVMVIGWQILLLWETECLKRRKTLVLVMVDMVGPHIKVSQIIQLQIMKGYLHFFLRFIKTLKIS
jgi:hypothetical protein